MRIEVFGRSERVDMRCQDLGSLLALQRLEPSMCFIMLKNRCCLEAYSLVSNYSQKLTRCSFVTGEYYRQRGSQLIVAFRFVDSFVLFLTVRTEREPINRISASGGLVSKYGFLCLPFRSKKVYKRPRFHNRNMTLVLGLSNGRLSLDLNSMDLNKSIIYQWNC